jgi:flagellar hook-associated protein 1 FlgK
MANITVSGRDPDEFIVYLGTVHLIQGSHAERIDLRENANNRGFSDLYWEGSPEPARIQTGEIASLLELRDVELDRQLRDLNTLAANLTDQINEIHRDGFDLNNNTNLDFFKTLPITANANGDFDRNNDGTPEMTALFKVAGRNTLNIDAEIGIAGTMTFAANQPGGAPITVAYVPQDTVRDVIRKINQSQSEVTAYLNHNGQLGLKATLAENKTAHMDFVLRHVEDSGDFLVNYAGLLNQSGAAGAYDWQTAGQAGQFQTYAKNISVTPMYDPASWMSVSDAVRIDVRSIAAARGTDRDGTGDANVPNGPGDGSNALLMAELRNKKTMVGMNETYNDFYTAVIAKTGVTAEQAEIQTKTADTLVEQLKGLRQSLSGVNLDEEMANLIMFQHAYNASARFVSIQDRMLETIIRMGL